MGFCKMKMSAWEYNRVANGFKHAYDTASENIEGEDDWLASVMAWAKKSFDGIISSSYIEEGDYDPETRDIAWVTTFVYDDMLAAIVWFSQNIGLADEDGYEYDYADDLIGEPPLDEKEHRIGWIAARWKRYCEDHPHPTKKAFACEVGEPYSVVLEMLRGR